MEYGDLETLMRKADEGDLDAMAQLGIAYLNGNRVEQDLEKAFVLLQDAALRSNTDGLYYLGRMYERGQFVDRDLWTAMNLFKKAYALKHPKARKALSDVYFDIADSTPVTGKLSVDNSFNVTACCDRFVEAMRMGRIIPLEYGDGVSFFHSSMTHDFPLDRCPFCGERPHTEESE